MNFNEMNAIGQALNASFGRSSIKDRGYGCNYKILGGAGGEEDGHILELRFETIINFNPRHGMTEQKKQMDDESTKVLNQCLSEAKREFKEISGVTLKTKELEQPEAVIEHISHNISLIRVRYCRSLKVQINT